MQRPLVAALAVSLIVLPAGAARAERCIDMQTVSVKRSWRQRFLGYHATTPRVWKGGSYVGDGDGAVRLALADQPPMLGMYKRSRDVGIASAVLIGAVPVFIIASLAVSVGRADDRAISWEAPGLTMLGLGGGSLVVGIALGASKKPLQQAAIARYNRAAEAVGCVAPPPAPPPDDSDPAGPGQQLMEPQLQIHR